MKKKEKSMGVNALLNSIKTILSIIFPLITYPYAARVLGVENIGKVDFSNSIVSYFVMLAGLGIVTYAVREGARVRDNKIELERFACEMFSINMLSAILSVMLLVITVFFVPRFHSYVILLSVQSLTIFGNLIGVTWLYTIEEDYGYITVRYLVVHIIALVLLFCFVHDMDDYILYASTTVVANVGANIFNFFHAKKYVHIRFSFHLNLKKHLKPILVIFASTITTTIYVNSDKTILGFLSDEFHVGLYSVSANVYTVLKCCVAAIIVVSLPRFSNYIAKGLKEEYMVTANYIFKMFIMVLMPIMVGVFVTSDVIVFLIGGESYSDATNSLKILSISLFFSMLATFYTNAVLLPMKQEVIVLKGTVLSATLNVLLNFCLLSKFHQNGAAFTTLLSEILMCVYSYVYAKQYFTINLKHRYIISILVGCSGIYLVSFICDSFIESNIICFIIKVAISVIVYILALILLKNDAAITLIQKLLHRKKG